MDLTQEDHQAIRNLVGNISSLAEGLDIAARDLPLILRSSKLTTIRADATAMAGLSEALRLAINLKRPAQELFDASAELSTGLQRLNQLVATTRATGPAKSAVAFSLKMSLELKGGKRLGTPP